MLVLPGLAVGTMIGPPAESVLPMFFQPHLSVAIVAALDATLGGTRTWLEGTFSNRVFVVSFLSNVFIAGPIVFAGNQIGVGSRLSTGVVVVLGIRTFNNAATTRRAVLHV